MLKRKLHRAGLITASFAIMAASSGKNLGHNLPGHYPDTCSNLPDSTATITHAFDSAGLCVCLHVLPIDELEGAPRIQLNRNVVKFVKDHVKTNAISLEKIKTEKGDKYFTLIDSVFTQYNIPNELKYLAVIESKLNTRAVSRVGAKGMWQFMPATARNFGLKVKGKYDERLYAYKSTVAAAKYLAYLYRLFDDWLLTIAAYNSGPGYVYAAIKKSGSRSFWILQRFLPLETRNHVKKFIGTHYYYEGHGSLTTITKAERNAHINAVAAYVEKQKEKMSTDAEVLSVPVASIEVSHK